MHIIKSSHRITFKLIIMNSKIYKFSFVAALLLLQLAASAQTADILYVFGKSAGTITEASYDPI